MNTDGTTRMDVTKQATTRRMVLKLGGGAALLVFAGATSSGTLAQEASPVASPASGDSLLGKYLVIRMRTVKPDRSADELMALIQDGFVPLVMEVPGFVWYVAAANPETREQFSIGVYADAEGAAESHRLAAEWGPQSGAADLVEGDPIVYEGEIGVSAASAAPADEWGGKHVAIRLRKGNPDWPVAEVMAKIGEGYVPLVEKLPGFVAYFGSADAESGDQAYVIVFDDKAGTDESTRVAGEWLTENDYTFFEGDPIVAEGIIGAVGEATS